MDAVAIIQQVFFLQEKDLAVLLPLFEEVQHPKNSLVIAAERPAHYLYFIKEGSCRIYYRKDEKEVILDFSFPGDALISLNSYVHGKVGYENIETMEDALLYRVNVRELQDLYLHSLGIANWGRKLAEVETLKIEYRLMSKLFKTASESYDELLQRAPHILHRIKLGFVASYLGINQVTLSRIRAKA